jgi:hypothetical protein
LRVDGRDIHAQRIVLSAGAGNAELLASLAGISVPAQQLRPLHMVLVKGPSLKPLYAHCLGGGPKPRITVTTHPAANGEWVWYLGGDIAEADGRGPHEPTEQIAVAQKELSNLLPWVDLSQAQWATLRVNRAEPAQSGLVRPDNAFLVRSGPLAGGLAHQAGAGAGLLGPRAASPGAGRHQTGSMPLRCLSCHARHWANTLGATAAMSQPTLHDLHRPLGSTGLLGVAAGPGHRQAGP